MFCRQKVSSVISNFPFSLAEGPHRHPCMMRSSLSIFTASFTSIEFVRKAWAFCLAPRSSKARIASSATALLKPLRSTHASLDSGAWPSESPSGAKRKDAAEENMRHNKDILSRVTSPPTFLRVHLARLFSVQKSPAFGSAFSSLKTTW